MEDLLNTEIGKHDYDWLLTPPGTPRFPALEVAEKVPPSNVSKHTTTRSSSTTRASRLSVYETENRHSIVSTRPARCNSRPSIQSAPLSSNNRSSVLNGSISSVSSRPTTPSKRIGTVPSSKPSVVASHPVVARSSTPVKTRPATPVKIRPSTPVKTRPATPVKTCPSTPDKTRPSVSNSMPNSTAVKATSAQNSRSSTPTSRPRSFSSSSSSTAPAVSRPSSSSGTIPAICRSSSSSSKAASVTRSSSRSSTPTRQPVMRSSAPPIARSPSVGRISGSNNLTSSGRSVESRGRISAPSSAPSSRPSSPNPRLRAPVKTLDLPHFPSDTPANLRTKIPDRPLSAGRARPGIGLGARSAPNAEPVTSAPVKKMSVPAITRSKFSDAPSKAPSLISGNQNRQAERSVMDSQPARPSRSATSAENGFGRTISRKSIDMAIKHMDIRQNLGGIRGASLFPHGIRSSTAKGQPTRRSDPGHHISNGDHGAYTDNGSTNGHFSGDSNGALSYYGGSSTDSPDRESIGAKETLSEVDIYGCSRYEDMLLREDTKNTDWLHSVDDKFDQSPVFDHRFEPLPEPFGPM
ncbi:uncharacterized protein DDB_G0271670 [Brachypodium distachyon]|uniref:Uncharacterized protein n=1 Tax=Brachypodium distachyon TaxID=15368 RepID=A0A0Q3GIW7_BRADI|nr:uncharacterized protein DDB_G0271670 [Brachypodium distachyon]KQK10333.1 hypothetical protein BRADI_2g53411v3 [Brachypodium distachyon]|eukprot:XP_003564487.1 uncharacterized protein DDB_G0271670 [Brachypodium distachyon]